MAVSRAVTRRGITDGPRGAFTPSRWSWPAAATSTNPTSPWNRTTGHRHTQQRGLSPCALRWTGFFGPVSTLRAPMPDEVSMNRIDKNRHIRAPRGTELQARSWLTEAPLRMLMNNLDPEVAEKPDELVVYGGIGRAARDWDSY